MLSNVYTLQKNDVNNYRSISLVSCFGKLFISIARVENNYNILTDAQFGFRGGLSTVDAIFALQAIIKRSLDIKNRLYCCFVDFEKAFDSIDRTRLWQNLLI